MAWKKAARLEEKSWSHTKLDDRTDTQLPATSPELKTLLRDETMQLTAHLRLARLNGSSKHSGQIQGRTARESRHAHTCPGPRYLLARKTPGPIPRYGGDDRNAFDAGRDAKASACTCTCSCKKDYHMVDCNARLLSVEGVLLLVAEAVVNPSVVASEEGATRVNDTVSKALRKGSRPTVATALDS